MDLQRLERLHVKRRNGNVLLAGVVTFGLMVGITEFQAAAAEPPDRTSKDVGAVLPPDDANKAVEMILDVARKSREGTRSVIAKGNFSRFSQRPDEKEPQQVTSGRLHLFFDDSKYHLKIMHDKMLRTTIDLPRGVSRSRVPGEFEIYRNESGEIVDVPTRIADWKADKVFIINDGVAITSTVYSPRIHPHGVRSKTARDLQDACLEVDVNLVDPTRLFTGVGQVELVVKNLGKDAIQVSSVAMGGFRVTYQVKNAPKVRVELDALPKDGFNVSATRVFNEGQELPAQAEEASWNQIGNQWVVTKLLRERRYTGSRRHTHDKEIVVYNSVQVNAWVDPTAFTDLSMADDWQPKSSADE